MWITIGLQLLQKFWPVIIGMVLAFYIVHWWHKHFNNDNNNGPRILSRVSGTVVRVDRGNSITIKLSRRREASVRLAMIGVAPADDPVGAAAVNVVTELTKTGPVDIKLTEHRRFHQDLVGIVWSAERQCLQYALVSRGLAWCTDCDQKDWLQAEAAAKKQKLGLWKVKTK